MKWPTFILGFLLSLIALLLIGEASARLSLPGDIRQHFGSDPARNGIYQPHPQLGADYRSYQDFRSENTARLAELGSLDLGKPTWLMFGNSFVQAPGMLADSARLALPAKRIFDLRKNIDLPLRAAQARQLLSAGLRPERILFVLLPIDLLQIGRRPLSFVAVDPQGGITTRLRWPEAPLSVLIPNSRLATIAWIRSGRADGDPDFDVRRVTEGPSARIQDDLLHILNHLAETSRRFGVPVTVVTLPNREQVFGRSGFGFQEAVRELTSRVGFDYFDARKPLIEAADKRALFLPDWHLSERGNAMVLEGLLEHLRTAGARPAQAS